MRYAVVNAKDETVSLVDVAELNDAKQIAGLEPMGTDHGTIRRGLGVVVYEFGLLEPAEHYFIAGGQLYAGNAVLYQYDTHGETIDFSDIPAIEFLHGIPAVEAALTRGAAPRPYVAFNGEKFSEWRDGALQAVNK